jgi:hypothetical protein
VQSLWDRTHTFSFAVAKSEELQTSKFSCNSMGTHHQVKPPQVRHPPPQKTMRLTKCWRHRTFTSAKKIFQLLVTSQSQPTEFCRFSEYCTTSTVLGRHLRWTKRYQNIAVGIMSSRCMPTRPPNVSFLQLNSSTINSQVCESHASLDWRQPSY